MITLFLCLIAVILFFSFVFFVAKAEGRYDLIDVVWGLAFIAIATVSYVSQTTITVWSIQTIVTMLVIVWGLRLSLHIYARWNHSVKEDGRYTDMKQQYAKKFGGVDANMYVRVFLVQALLAVIISASIVLGNVSYAVAPTWLTTAGASIWLIGFLFETIGDAQLKRHLKDPKNVGKLMTTGLWRYTRHPNYFGEAAQWWGIWVIVLAVPYGWVSIVGPLTITILLLFISGVPLTEKRFEGRPGWDAYKKRTSMFVPFLIRKGK